MTAEDRRRLLAGPFTITLTTEEILEDLLWPGRLPGPWLDSDRKTRARPLSSAERAA